MTTWIPVAVIAILLAVGCAAFVLEVLNRRRTLVAPKYSAGRLVLHRLRCVVCGKPLEDNEVAVTSAQDGKIAHLSCHVNVKEKP